MRTVSCIHAAILFVPIWAVRFCIRGNSWSPRGKYLDGDRNVLFLKFTKASSIVFYVKNIQSGLIKWADLNRFLLYANVAFYSGQFPSIPNNQRSSRSSIKVEIIVLSLWNHRRNIQFPNGTSLQSWFVLCKHNLLSYLFILTVTTVTFISDTVRIITSAASIVVTTHITTNVIIATVTINSPLRNHGNIV